ncbi:MAG: SDR family NAD(P)-dependent oxidoreductase [Acidimicrobiales bacterium]|jgi:short-subunit dehydrogenase|nr:SDR family NAD(P)-dependent oxidoreductase [Acidimicrobiales bacterium]
MELRGRRVLITGASRGIGEALAEAFAAQGAQVALVARSADALERLAGRLGGTAHPADLADPTAVAGLLARVEAEAGPVDVVVNNAGYHEAGWFPDQDDLLDAATFQLNVLTPLSLCRQAVPGMLRRGGGHLVNISSMAGFVPFPGLAVYGATKAALSQFTAGLRADLRGLPVGTTLVEIGPVPTDMLSEINDYRPAGDAFGRMARLQLSVDAPRELVADETVAAVRRGTRHVRLPRRGAPFAMVVEAPRRLTEVLLTGVRHRQD